MHTAARGEQITCFLLNNGVFGETGGHMTATTRARPAHQEHASRAATPNSMATRSVIGDLIAELEGVAYVGARGGQHAQPTWHARGEC